MSNGRILLLESPNAIDLLEERGETSSLEKICKLLGYDTATFLLRDRSDLESVLLYISSVGWSNDDSAAPLFIHLSCHGSASGIAVGPHDVEWDELAGTVLKMFKEIYKEGTDFCYPGPIVLVLSACHANKQKLTRIIKARHKAGEVTYPPEYVFVTTDPEVAWQDAVVTWTIFYRHASEFDFADDRTKRDVMTFLQRMKASGFGELAYWRWDDDKYLRFTPKKKG